MRIIVTCFLACWGITGINAQNVGIGTTTPVSKLTIQTTLNAPGLTHIAGTSQVIVDESIGVSSASIGTNTNHAFRIKANNAGLLHVYPGGEVVVGNNLTGSFGRFTVETLNNSYGISHLGENGNILATRMGGTSAGIGTFSNTNMRLFCNGNNVMIIDAANGNIGIGTDAPTAKLHVAGAMNIDGLANFNSWAQFNDHAHFINTIGVGAAPDLSIGVNINHDLEALRLSGNQPFVTFFNNGNYKGYMWSKGTDDIEVGTAGVNANGKLFLSIKGTPRLSISNTGQVSINGAASPYLSPDLTVNGTLSLYVSGQSEWGLRPSYCPGEGGPCLFLYGVGVERSKVDADGDWIPLSDRSLKENIQEYKPVLEGLKKIQVSTYHFKYNSPGKKSFGLIAQNVADHFPEIVSSFTCKDGKNLLGISYGKTGVLAIKAIQEQQEIIEQQQSKIESLEKRLVALEKMIEKK